MKKTLTVKGMSCQNCVKRVSKIIAKAEHTADVQVDLAKEQAVFDCDPQQIDMNAILKDLSEYGFEASE